MWATSPAASVFAKSTARRKAVHDIPLPQFPWIPHLIRHEVMHVPSGLWQLDKPADISPRTRTTTTQEKRGRRKKKTQNKKKTTTAELSSACKNTITFHPAFNSVIQRWWLFLLSSWSPIFGSCPNVWQSRDVIDFIPSVFIFYLNPLFPFHIHWLRSLFPLLSMHEADSTGEPRDL